MKTHRTSFGVLACPVAVLLVAACATPPPKQANDYDDSPPSTSVSSRSSESSSDSQSSSEPSSSSNAMPADTASASGGALPANAGIGWDREATQQELARAARQVKANCGSATDDEGKANGPWGKTQVSVRLWHKGRTKEPKASGEFAGTPVGRCIERAFTDLQFPPWQGHDVTIDYDIEVVKPGSK